MATIGAYGSVLLKNQKQPDAIGAYGKVLLRNFVKVQAAYGRVALYSGADYNLGRIGNIHLIEVDAYNPDTASVETLRFCSHRGFCTKPTETPANTMYLPRVKQPGLTRWDIYSKGKTGGASTMAHGEIVLVNIDGGLDDLIDYGFDGRTLIHRTGPEKGGSYPTDYPVQETYTVEQLRVSWEDVSLIVRDKQYVFDRPLQTSTYAGTNTLPYGLEGTENDLKGKRKPLIYGYVDNILLPCVNTSKLIYQINDGSFDLAYLSDRGLGWLPGTDYTDEADMLANAPAAGEYRLLKTDGYVRLGSPPAGQLTARVYQSFPLDEAGELIEKVCLQAGLDSNDIDATDLSDLDMLQSASLGVVVGDKTGREVMDELCQSIGAWWSFDRYGVLRVKRLDAPVLDSNSITLTTTEVKNNISRDPTGDTDRGVPVYKVILKYHRNYTVQTNDLAGALTSPSATELNKAKVAFLANEWRTVTAEDAAVQTKHPLAAEFVIETGIYQQDDAQAEADRQLALRKVRRDRITVTVLADIFSQIELGDVVELKVPRFDLTDGKPMVVIGRQPDYRLGRGELTLWG